MKRELIEHIKSQLNEFDLEYREGAWEHFQEKNKKNRKIIPWRKIMGAAAVLTLLLLAIPWRIFRTGSEGLTDQRRKRSVAVCSSGPIADTTEKIGKRGFTPRSYLKKSATMNRSGGQNTDLVQHKPETAPVDTVADKTAYSPGGETSGESSEKTMEKPKMSLEDLLAADHQAPFLLRGHRKWHFAIAVGQALDTRSKTDFHIATYINYQLNSRFSLSSGLSYNQFGGEKKIPLPAPSARSGKMLSGAQADLQGIDIPLELQAKAGNKLYVKIGISASALTNQQQRLDFSEQKVQVNTYVDPKGVTRSETVIIEEVTTETVPEEKLKQNRVSGFYNFSLGYQQRVTKNHTIGLEPFIKIPMSSYSEQHLNLVQAGIRVKVDF